MGLLEAHASLAGRRAVVVGGAGGIGRAVSIALAKAGIGIASCDIDEQATRMIVPEIEALGQRVLSVHADVRDADALDRFYDRVDAEFDGIDIVVNVAGGVKRAPFLDTTRDQNAVEIRLNFGYVIHSLRRAFPLLPTRTMRGSLI